MRRAVFHDCWGDRWTVRARKERHARPESEYTRRLREPSLRARLRPALSPQPGASTAIGASGAGHAQEDGRYAAGLVGMQAAGLGGPVGWVVGIALGVRVLTEPSDRFWVVELVARGRIRRGATWKVAGREDAARVAVAVADAVRTGQVPEPDDALLIDVVDERLTVHGTPR